MAVPSRFILPVAMLLLMAGASSAGAQEPSYVRVSPPPALAEDNHATPALAAPAGNVNAPQAAAHPAAHAVPNPYVADSALKLLKAGNQRFVDGQVIHPNQEKPRRDQLTAGQQPMAAILACSDSRVPVELLFDVGFGDVFVIRDAGNVPGVDEIGSIEYAVEHLGAPLVVVLGHTKCGAVTGAVQGGPPEPGALGELLAKIKPAALAVTTLPADQQVPAAVHANVEQGLKQLTAKSDVLAKAVKEGRTKIVGAVYQLEDGQVIFK
ncbi:MAG: carbonic anhydrase [Candidatus Adiutrix sp.]|nr:carbonic anhydrase [Candidatus Adiutrix sp.]